MKNRSYFETLMKVLKTKYHFFDHGIYRAEIHQMQTKKYGYKYGFV